MEGFTKKDLQGAYLAHKAQSILSHSSDKTFGEMVSGISGILNIPSRPLDLANANHIYGKDLGGVRDKTTRIKPDCVY